MNELETAIKAARDAVRKAQEAITNQEGTYAELDAMLNSLDDMIEDQVWA